MFRQLQKTGVLGATAVAGVAASSLACNIVGEKQSHSDNANSKEGNAIVEVKKPHVPTASLRTIDKSIVDLEGYKRIDELMMQFLSKDHIAKNAVHGTLCGNSLIEVYEIYFNKQKEELLCLVHFGTELNGHPGIVHGGITATVFDNSFGWLFMASKLPVAFTASLNVNYRSKVSEDSTVILRAKVKEHVGRKMFFEATLHDTGGKLLADSTSLFISARPPTDNADEKTSLPPVATGTATTTSASSS